MNFSPGLISDLESKSWLDLSAWSNRFAVVEPNSSPKNPVMDTGIPRWDELPFFRAFNPESSSYSGLQRIPDSDANTGRMLSGNFLNGDEKAVR